MTLAAADLRGPNQPKNVLAKISIPWIVVFAHLFIILLFPLLALLLQAIVLNPAQFWALATTPIALSTYNITFGTATVAAIVNMLAGTLTAWVLVRYQFPGKRFLDGIIDLPFALPTAVAGITLATIYNQSGWIGQFFAPFGIQIAFSRVGVAIAMIFVSLPFVVRTVQPVLQEVEPTIEEAAWSLGASRFQTFWKVILPPIIPAILTGTAQAFARAVGEFGSVVLVAANVPFQDLIAPVLVFQRLEGADIPGATVIGLVLLLISLVLLLIINLLQAWGRRYDV
ncbi:sulfate ABC transporter permease subunit CysT [Nodosilinea sp. PGN35]|uniref:sulfate ABC transporter permease subunit CysT n=1 Tax=Nodosilinea sp. PGN35 TaxID=3020489 RepID=UPI0023B326C2|nr:sulfate ABC transporter permease subunit CysT [Nodosilinea sp. TSF1-S3]MDF0368355.1 sulfate ABC transporter permease subunit CysT [Nodosilinea sp. TSF1-S3]